MLEFRVSGWLKVDLQGYGLGLVISEFRGF